MFSVLLIYDISPFFFLFFFFNMNLRLLLFFFCFNFSKIICQLAFLQIAKVLLVL